MYINPTALFDCFALLIIIQVGISTSFSFKKNNANIDKSEKLFAVLLLFTGAMTIVDGIGYQIDGKIFAGSYYLQMLFNSLLWIFQMLVSLFWIKYVFAWINADEKSFFISKKLYCIPAVTEIVMIIINMFTGFVFYIDKNGYYRKGKCGYFICMALILFYTLVAIILSLIKMKKSSDINYKKKCLALSAFLFFPCAIGFPSNYLSEINLMVPMYSLTVLTIYLNVQGRNIEEKNLTIANQKSELMQNKISIMLSQIQPHFLYNALCVIQDLCHGKADDAEQATIEFSRFLRGNLDSLSEEKPISFEKELEHTRNYLSLEKRRFRERLNTEYHIETTAFRIPALTLQPIVENAVRYGVTSRVDGGTVCISAGEDENNFIVTVRDNGKGFDMPKNDSENRSHIGISNVKNRLEIMCCGTLEITSKKGVGTLVIITIPKFKGSE